MEHVIEAARRGDTAEMLYWFNEPHDGQEEHWWDANILSAAALNGHTETMLAAVTNGCLWWGGTTSDAAFYGHTETILTAVEHGCLWAASTTASAAFNGHNHTMLVAVAHGCPWSQHTTADAAHNGHTETMLAAVNAGCPWSPRTTAKAAYGGHTETMLAAVRAGCPWDEYTGREAGLGGHSDTILAVLDNGAPPDPQMWGFLHFFPGATLFESMMYVKANRLEPHYRWYWCRRPKMRALLRVLLFISRWIFCTGHGRLRDIAFAKVARRIRSGQENLDLEEACGTVDGVTEKRLRRMFDFSFLN